MAELSEWSAQALGCDGPVKVIYFRSRGDFQTKGSPDQYYHAEKSKSSEQSIPFEASVSSDTVYSGHLFDFSALELAKDWTNYILQEEKSFEDSKSAIEDLTSKFNIPKVVPFDQESTYGRNYSYTGSRIIKPPEDQVLLYLHLLNYVTNARDIKVGEGRKDGSQGEKFKRKQSEGLVEAEKVKKEKKEEKKEEEKDNNKKDEANKRKELEERLRNFQGVAPPDVRLRYQHALIYGITTEFNPNGMWIVEDFICDEEEIE